MEVIYLFQPKMPTFSMHALIWLHHKVGSKFSPLFLHQFSHFIFPRQNSFFELCHVSNSFWIFLMVMDKVDLLCIAIYFWYFLKNADFHFYISKYLTFFWINIFNLSKHDCNKKTWYSSRYSSMIFFEIIINIYFVSHFLMFITIFLDTYHGESNWMCLQTHPEQ